MNFPSPSHPAAEGGSHPRDSHDVASEDVSEPTLPGDQNGFSLEKTMRNTLKRLVIEFTAYLCSDSQPLSLEESGITPRTLGVYFKDLRVIGTGVSSSFQSTVGSRLNPKVAYNDIRRALRPETRDILTGFNGVIRPGEMLRKSPFPNRIISDWMGACTTVVLGSPGSGCTTFLKTLANQRQTYYDVLGDVFYNSLNPDEMKAHYRGDLQVRSSICPPFLHLLTCSNSSFLRMISISLHSQWKKLSGLLQRPVLLRLALPAHLGRTT